jgi:hypothetical protein
MWQVRDELWGVVEPLVERMNLIHEAANPASMPTPADTISPPHANTRRNTPRRHAGKAGA